MALTVTKLGRTNVIGNRLSVALKVVPDDSWLAAGEALDLPAETGIGNIETVHIDSDIGGYVWNYDRSAKKLFAYNVAGQDQTPTADFAAAALVAVANAVDLSGQTLYITVTGGRA
tara:strand:- start:4205 stop:4552 length:348 start_codon:yes stop_codon:yes gene_type:complete